MKLITTALFAFALTSAACGKKTEPAPETKPAETKPAETKPTDAPTTPPATTPPATTPPETKPADPGLPTASDLPELCKKYLTNVKACAEAMPESSRGTLIEALKKTEETWKLVPKDQMESSCKSAWDSSKDAMAAACPNVKWE